MTEKAYLLAWFKAFVLTNALEIPIVAAMFRRREPRLFRLIALSFFANLGSHPAVWFIFPALGLPYGSTVLIAEAWAFGIEAIFYALAFDERDYLYAAGVSALANGVSYGLGLVLRGLTGWV